MDYDDNDFQGHNLHLAGEGSSKFSPVLNPYALPKFDFDDSLQGQLRFDSLVENEVFLGIPSQEDNQWIEDFSRGSSGIEFSSSVPESCSISRHNNVWSEATSSESVEMLLKSVGQEEMVPGETIIKESDACDELGSLTKRMESNSKQDDRLKDAIDSHPALPPSEFLENSSGLDESAGRTQPHVEGASQTQVVELSAHGSPSELESSVVDEKCGLCVTEKNLATDRKCNDAIETEADASVNESLDNKMQKDPSVSGMQICHSSSQDDNASVGELNNQEIQHQLSDISFENANGLSNDISKRVEEEHVARKDTNMADLNLKGSAVETGTYNLESPLCSAPKLDSLEGHAVESNTNNVEESSLPLERDGDLEIAEGCSEDACSTDPAQGSECGAVVLSERTEINQQDTLEAPVVFQGDSNIEGHAVEINNTTAGILAVSNLEMGSDMQITHGQSSSIEKKENLLESDHQLVCEASVNNSEVSLLSGVHFEQSNGQGDGSRNDHVGDPSNLRVVCSSNELLMETKAIETLEIVNDSSGIHKKDVNAEHHVSPPMLAGSEQICESNLVTKQGDVHHAEDVSLNEKGNEKLPTNSCDMDCEIVGSLSLDKRVGPSCLGEGIKGNDMVVHKLEHDLTAMNELAMNVALENTNLATHNKFDNVSLPSVNGATADGVTNHSDEQKSPSLVVGFMNLHGSEETKVEVSKEANLLTLKKFSNGANELGPVSGLETGSSNSAGQLLQVGNEVRQDGSRKLEDCPVLCDSFVKEDDNEAVVLENHGKATREENHDAVTSGVAVDISKDPQRLFGLARLSECDANCALEGGGSYADSDKPNCGSPIIVSCTELSQSGKDLQEGVKGSLGTSVPPSEVSDEITNKAQSTSPTQRGSDATKDERSFSFEVPPLTGQSERETSKGLQSFSTAPSCKISTVVEGTSTSCGGKMDPVMVPEISHGSPRAPNGENSHGRSKGTLGRKTRRVSGKLIGKENTKKGNLVKESVVARQSERGDKSYSVSMSPSGTGQLVQFEGLKPFGNVENSGTRQCGVFSIPASNLLDLNSSTLSSVLFQQPFTDLQQVQLRAQIFVYGSLIQGTVPDEACMVSAFGTSDGGRNVWEPVWRACVASIQGQKSHPSNSEIPNQSRSGAKASDQAIKQGASQNKVLPSPVGRACSKGTPSPAVNSMIPPPSSPLWNISNGLQSSGVAKGTLLDYQPISPLHPYHTPPTHNFVGHNTSWLSQAPFPGAWVASPQTSAFDGSARFSVMPITEAVKLTPVKESSLSISSSTKHASSSPVVLSGGPSVSAGASSLLDMKKATVSPGQHSADPKSRKRKKVPVSEDLGHVSLLAQTQTESLSTPVVSSHLSTSVVVTTPAFSVSKSNAGKIISNVRPTSSSDQLKLGDQNAEQKLTISEGTFNKVELAMLEAEEAAALAAAAVSHSQDVWNQLNKHKNSRMISDVEAKLASAAVAVAAAAAVAKAAAAAAKVASNAALQAKLMAEGALASGTGNTVISPYNTVNNLGKATPSSILKGEGGDGSNCSNSIIVAAREAARGKLEAASAASKHAENLDAIVKAAELAAEAVSQAGKIVSMGDPLPLRELIDAGPEGYWKVPLVPSEQGVKSNKVSKEHSNVNSVEEGFNVSAKQAKEGLLDERETTEHGLPPLSREISRESVKDHTRVVDGISGSVTSSEKNLRGQKGRRASDLAKTIGVVPESEIGSRSTSVIIQDEYEKASGNLTENSIKEGSLVEVFKDGDFKAAWFSANVLTLKDGKALVCYTELQSDEGPGHLQEWVAIEGEDSKAPRIRIAHPMTIMRFEGMRKRRRAAMGDYAWSVGDKVDAWVQDCWREGVVTEKNRNDETALSVRFPAEEETSVVRAWHLRPTLIWKDGKWIEWSTSREKDSSLQGDLRQQKRLKMGSPAIQGEDNDKMSKNIDLVDSRRVEQSHLLPLTANEKIFSVGNHSREENKPDVIRTMRSGLQKEGSKVIFGVPKPGKKRKFMEVSKHYVTERSSNNNESNDSVKFGKYLMPQVSDSRGWKNNSKIDFKEKLAAESKPKVVKSRKPPSVSGRTLSQKDKFLTSARSDDTITDHIMTDSISNDENESGQRNLREFGSFSNSEEAEEGPILFSSLALPLDVSSKKLPTSNAKSERLNKGKLAASGGKLGKSEVKDKVYNGNMGKTIPEVVEPRRTTRRIQPTSRLLEGLQSSLIISKIPATSHDKSHKSTNKGTSKGNSRG